MKKIAYSKAAIKVLKRLDAKRRKAIQAKIEDYAAGRPTDAKALAGSPFIRLRIGQYRAILDDQANVVAVVKVGPRGDVYK